MKNNVWILLVFMFLFTIVTSGCRLFCEYGVGAPIVDIPFKQTELCSFQQAVDGAANERHWNVVKIDECTFRLTVQKSDNCTVDVKRNGNTFSIIPVESNVRIGKYNSWANNLKISILHQFKGLPSGSTELLLHFKQTELPEVARTNAWKSECQKWRIRHKRNKFVSLISDDIPEVCYWKNARRWQAVGLASYHERCIDVAFKSSIERIRNTHKNSEVANRIIRDLYENIVQSRRTDHETPEEVRMKCNSELRLAYQEKLELDLMRAVEFYEKSCDKQDRMLIAEVFNEYPELYASPDALELAQRKYMTQLPIAGESSEPRKKCSGTGWFVASNIIVTCLHVVENGKTIKYYKQNGIVKIAKCLASDKETDLAVLEVENVDASTTWLPLQIKALKLADKVCTFGYPLPSLLGQNLKYTDGSVSGMTGIANDPRVYQISVPIQPGNSGGALLNDKGYVVGITSSGLNAIKTAQLTGSLPQNVNYAIKVRYLTALLDDNGINYSTDDSTCGFSGKELSERAKTTVMIMVEK